MLLSPAVSRAMNLLPCCCHGFFALGFRPLLPFFCCHVAALSWLWFLPCWFVAFGAGRLWLVYDLCLPVGHHAPLQPLVTGPHLHPSPASSSPSSSSLSTLPSSSQSSVTGPPRFSFSYPLFSHNFSFIQGEGAICKCFHFNSVAFTQLTLHPCVSSLLCVFLHLLPHGSISLLVALVLKRQPILQSQSIS